MIHTCQNSRPPGIRLSHCLPVPTLPRSSIWKPHRDLQSGKPQGSQKFPHPSPCIALSTTFRAGARTNVSNTAPFRQQITRPRLFGPLDSTAPAHPNVITSYLSLLFSRQPASHPPTAPRTHASHPQYKGKISVLHNRPVSTLCLPRPPIQIAPYLLDIPAQNVMQSGRWGPGSQEIRLARISTSQLVNTEVKYPPFCQGDQILPYLRRVTPAPPATNEGKRKVGRTCGKTSVPHNVNKIVKHGSAQHKRWIATMMGWCWRRRARACPSPQSFSPCHI